MSILSRNLKYLRKKSGLNQEELALKISITQSGVSAYERGICLPNNEKLILLSELFNTNLDDLVNKDLTLQNYPEKDDIKDMDTSNSQVILNLKREVADLRELVAAQKLLIENLSKKL